jgi:hypothetical protein
LAGVLGHNTAGGVNAANIVADIKATGSQNIGGIVGYSGGNVTVNVAKVTGNFRGTKYISAILAYQNGNLSTDIENVIADATLKGTERIGEIIGELKTGDATIKNALARGNVTGTGSKVGGLIGCANGAKVVLDITNSAYIGEAKGGNDYGPVVGFGYAAVVNTSEVCVYGETDTTVNTFGRLDKGGNASSVEGTIPCLTRAELAKKVTSWTNFDLDTAAYSAIFGNAIIAAQTGYDGADEPTPAVRFISTLDGTDYVKVGIKISISKDGGASVNIPLETMTVYEAVKADGKDELASSYGADYLYALGLNQFDIEGEWDFVITSFVVVADETAGTIEYVTDTANMNLTVENGDIATVNGKAV